MGLWILRAVFLLATLGAGWSFITEGVDISANEKTTAFIIILALAAAVVAVDALIPRKRIDVLTCIYFGIFVGLFLAATISNVIDPLIMGDDMKSSPYSQTVKIVLGICLCYGCISMLLQTKDDFRFIIPYVEFSKEVKGLKPYVLDTSVVIDGRIADVVETGILDSQLIMPRFVIAELQGIADSSDKLKRSRGRRGLDILNQLRTDNRVDMKIFDRELPEFANQPVDMKLVLLAKHVGGKVVTGDYNLNKVANLHTVPVINLNDIANALKPAYLPGENFEVRVVKAGEADDQGVGYLDDGTMIVVEGGRGHINETVNVAVTSVLQKSAGRMIFCRFESVVSSNKP